VRTPADEASAALITAQAGLWIMNKILTVIMITMMPIEWLVSKIAKQSLVKAFAVLLVLLGVSIPVMVITWIVTLYGGAFLFLAVLLSIPFISLCIIVLISTAITAPLAFSGLLMTFMMGPRLALSLIYLDVAAEPAPPGIHTINQSGFRADSLEQIKASLNHSIGYQAPEIIGGIVDWVRKELTIRSRTEHND
jgi:hypothetical protein